MEHLTISALAPTPDYLQMAVCARRGAPDRWDCFGAVRRGIAFRLRRHLLVCGGAEFCEALSSFGINGGNRRGGNDLVRRPIQDEFGG